MNPPLKVTRIENATGLELLKQFFAKVKQDQGGVIGWDIETTPLKDFYFRKVRTIQFGNQTEQFVIDLQKFCQPPFNPALISQAEIKLFDVKTAGDILGEAQGSYGAHLTPALKEVLDVIAPVVCSRDFLKVGVMLSFEYMNFYWQFGLRTFHFFDCALVEKVINAGAMPLKQYANFSMEEMMARYFRVQIDKKYQESFTLDADLDDEQVAYAALDTRFPFPIMKAQVLILKGKTYKAMIANGEPAAALKYIDPIVTGDNLLKIAQVENDAIGSFQDMHIHGERLDRPRWLGRVQKSKDKLKILISDVLDPIFLPIVGSKADVITNEDIEEATAKWKKFNELTDAELQLKAQSRTAKKIGDLAGMNALVAQMSTLETERKAEKEIWKAKASELGKRRTKIKNLVAQCEGEALINYGSDAQLLKIITGFKGLSTVENLKDETLEKFSHKSVMKAIQDYHGLQKEIGTYGDQWAMQWVTKPCKEEGWLHPGDGRLHCVFNQYDAETGRSSSEKPNGQNLPQDKEVRGCFIADDPDESVRVSDCCDAEAEGLVYSGDEIITYECSKCGTACNTHAEDYVIVTADMSGAELRIIAELANDPVWIEAFERGEDVHSVCTHFLYGKVWETEMLPSIAKPDGWTLEDCKNEVVLVIPGKNGDKDKKIGPCAYYATREDGTLAKQKCDCPAHSTRRNATKAINFLLAYGGGPSTLAKRLGCTQEDAADLMRLHSIAFAAVWAYLDKSGKDAGILNKSFDMYGRRRLFPKPTNDRAKAYAKVDNEEKLRLPEEVAEKNVAQYFFMHGEKPDGDNLWNLTHRQPDSHQVARAFRGLGGSIQRQGKNHAIQGTNATIAKLAMGCGYDKDGIPYLWHTLPLYKAKLIKFVHDELVVQCPKRYAKIVVELIGDAFKRAAAAEMKQVVMEFDANVATYWKK